MRAATTSTVLRPAAASVAGQRSRGYRLAGLAVASLAPALFWAVMLALTSNWLNAPLSMLTIEITGVAIALFLAAVCAPLILRDRS